MQEGVLSRNLCSDLGNLFVSSICRTKPSGASTQSVRVRVMNSLNQGYTEQSGESLSILLWTALTTRREIVKEKAFDPSTAEIHVEARIGRTSGTRQRTRVRRTSISQSISRWQIDLMRFIEMHAVLIYERLRLTGSWIG